jgi:nesprin-1
MLGQLKVVKERLVRIRKDIPEKLRPLKTLLPQVESLETGISDLNTWLDDGEALLASHRLDGNIGGVEDRLEKHKSHFQQTTYHKSMLESKNKVFQKISKTTSSSRVITVKTLETSMVELNKRFQMTITKSKDWEQRLEKAVKQWRIMQAKAQPVEEWLVKAEHVMADNDDSTDNLIIKHKNFFEKTDPQIFKDFEQAGEELLHMLEEEDRPEVEESIAAIHNKYQEVLSREPIRLLHLQFRVPEDSFMRNVDVAEKTLLQYQEKLESKENMKETVRKAKVIFKESELFPTCDGCLDEMRSVSEKFYTHNGDPTLKQKQQEHQEKWDKLKADIEALLSQLEQGSERWNLYHQKLEQFVTWMDSVDVTLKDLEQESASTQEYKEMIAKFEKVVENINQHRSDAKWLANNRNDLLKTAEEEEREMEEKRLDDTLQRYKTLMPAIEITTTHSTIVMHCIEYREEVEQKASWLTQAEEQLKQEIQLDDVQAVRVLLEEQKNLLDRLDSEKEAFHSELATGHALMQEEHAPQFLHATVNNLEQRWMETTNLAKARYEQLKETLANWEDYESSRAQVADMVKKGEAEVKRTPSKSNHEAVQKDLHTKQEMVTALGELHPVVLRLQELTHELRAQASQPRQQDMQDDLHSLEGKLYSVSDRLKDRLNEVAEQDRKYTEFYDGMTHFTVWLNERQEALDKINKSQMPPEEKLVQTKIIYEEISQNAAQLEAVENSSKDISKGSRSREYTAIKTNLSQLRHQWEKLRSQAEDESTTLSGHVEHYQQYQASLTVLMPWLDKAEEYLNQPVGQSASKEQAQKEFDHHQDFTTEKDEQQGTYDELVRIASQLTDKENITSDLDSLCNRWDNMCTATDGRQEELQKALDAWHDYSQGVDNVQKMLDKFSKKLEHQPDIHSTEIKVLEGELRRYEVLTEDLIPIKETKHSFQSCHSKLQPYLNQDGAQNIASQHDGLINDLDTVECKVCERTVSLEEALNQRRQFYMRWDDLEKWLKQFGKKMASLNEIFSDEVNDASVKIEGMQNDCKEKEPAFENMASEVQELTKFCSQKEADVLKEKLSKLEALYQQQVKLLGYRSELCPQWVNYSAVQKGCQEQIQMAQQQLDTQELGPPEIQHIEQELGEARSTLQEWDGRRKDLDDLMIQAQMVIKDRHSHKKLHFQSEIQNVLTIIEKITVLLQEKQGKIDELSKLWKEYENLQQGLHGAIDSIGQRVDSSGVREASLQGIKDLSQTIKDLEQELESHNPEFEEFSSVAKDLVSADVQRGPEAQAGLTTVEVEWENLHDKTKLQTHQLEKVVTLYEQYLESKATVHKVISRTEPVTQAELVFSSQPEVKEMLEEHKVAQSKLHGQQRQL